jgi:uncharacterized repeat protein (TIGR03943 family)
MNRQSNLTLHALLLAILGVFLVIEILEGNILLYINQRFIALIGLTVLLLIVMSQVVLQARAKPTQQSERLAPQNIQINHASIWWIAVPVLIAFIIPVQTLNASSVSMHGLNTSSPLSAQTSVFTTSAQLAPADRTILDWIRIYTASPNLKELGSPQANLTGFVYHDARLSTGQFMIARFAITNSVADATAVGMVVNWPQAADLPENTWVRVIGKTSTLILSGQRLPAITADAVETIPEPDQPYLIP